MRPQLKYWRELPKEEKHGLMEKYGIKTITFHQIEIIHEKESKKL